ncbi:MAG: long-chain-fatty-acid--CoA ligase [Acidobacteria bacterium]|nr:long-chain-fatty-acid--CoA ligase [Acidobacteriota bacterium]
MNSTLTPLTFLARSAQVYRDRVAVVDGGRRFTYAEMEARCHRLASALRALGATAGDRIAVLAPNTPMALEVHWGVPLMGGVLVMLNYRLQAPELAWIVNHCGAKVLLADPQYRDMMEEVRGDMPLVEHIISDHEAFLETGSAPLPDPHQPNEDDLFTINYTSGTTGFPKGVMFTHRGAYLNALGEGLEHGLTNETIYLWTLPLFHCNGWCFPWAVTAVGGTHVLLRQVDGQRIEELIEGEAVTHLCGAPVVINTIAQHFATRGKSLPRFLKMVTAGAPPSPAVIRAASEIGADVAHVYGLTETYGPMTICAWRAEWNSGTLEQRAVWKARQGVGYVIAGTDVAVFDPDMRSVPADGATLGEVCMRGNNVMLGYYNNPAATAEAFRGGWFHSGDLAVLHPDGYIELRDRAKDIVISGGENISSIEVEKAIMDHPAVLEAAVVAAPDAKWGEVPAAFVGLKPGMSVTAEELAAFCRERIAHFKCPKRIEFGPLPKTATGKTRKNELRERLWQGHEKRIH